MKEQPTVSVLMTAFNREKYIAESIESVLASTYTNIELIIVDDCSIDNTVNIAKSYKEKDARVKLYVNEQNLGDYGNRNKAASYAKGKYLKYLDSDDTIYPWGLYAMVCCMEKYPEAGYGLIALGIKTRDKLPLLFSPIQTYYAFYFEGALILSGPSGGIIRRDVFENVNGFSSKPFISDTEFWLKMSKMYSMVAMPLDLVWWRQHEEQQIKYENKNKEIEAQRYNTFLNALLDKNCPFKEIYKSNAIRNLKNRYARNILIYFSKGQIKRSLILYKLMKLTPLDIIKSFRFNKYPPAIKPEEIA